MECTTCAYIQKNSWYQMVPYGLSELVWADKTRVILYIHITIERRRKCEKVNILILNIHNEHLVGHSKIPYKNK